MPADGPGRRLTSPRRSSGGGECGVWVKQIEQQIARGYPTSTAVHRALCISLFKLAGRRRSYTPVRSPGKSLASSNETGTLAPGDRRILDLIPHAIESMPRPPMRSPAAILLVFANDWGDDRRHLRSLFDESKAIDKALAPLVEIGALVLPSPIHNATVNDVIGVFRERRYRDRIRVFHFGGHASGSMLLFEDEAGKPTEAHANGLAGYLGRQRGLVLVVLNGCCTEPQVRRLREAGVKAVVATTRAIQDAVAGEFAKAFYSELAARSLRDAFETAVQAVRLHWGDDPRAVTRDVAVGAEAETPRWPWVLDCAPDYEAWTLASELAQRSRRAWWVWLIFATLLLLVGGAFYGSTCVRQSAQVFPAFGWGFIGKDETHGDLEWRLAECENHECIGGASKTLLLRIRRSPDPDGANQGYAMLTFDRRWFGDAPIPASAATITLKIEVALSYASYIEVKLFDDPKTPVFFACPTPAGPGPLLLSLPEKVLARKGVRLAHLKYFGIGASAGARSKPGELALSILGIAPGKPEGNGDVPHKVCEEITR